MFLAGPPSTPPAVPTAVSLWADGRTVEAVWINQLGGTTFRVGRAPDHDFIKWAPAGTALDLGAEAERLRWATAYAAVPEVIGRGSDEAGTWLATAGLTGESAVSERWRAEPDIAVRAIGAGLRALHDALPTTECPFDWSVEDRVLRAHERAAAGHQRPSDWHRSHGRLTVDEALARLDAAPPIDRLVVCHGDACAPNTLIGPDGSCAGHVDLGTMGVADRWADLAIATWSTQWNYGPGHEDSLLEAYDIRPDPERTAYYRLLWDLT